MDSIDEKCVGTLLNVSFSEWINGIANRDRNKSVCGRRVSISQYQPFSICSGSGARVYAFIRIGIMRFRNQTVLATADKLKRNYSSSKIYATKKVSLIKSPLYFSMISFFSVTSFGPIFSAIRIHIYISQMPSNWKIYAFFHFALRSFYCHQACYQASSNSFVSVHTAFCAQTKEN